MEANIKFYKLANEAYNVSLENFWTEWFFYTLIPIFSAVFLIMNWTVENIQIIGAMNLDLVSLIAVDQGSEKYSVNWLRIGWIGFCQMMIFLIEIPIIIVSWIPLFNIPINLLLMSFILFFNWRIDEALGDEILRPKDGYTPE